MFVTAESSTSIAELVPAALAATTAAAAACQGWVGAGDPTAADRAATEAMRAVLAGVPGTGTVVIGEGEKDAAPMLHNGERVGGGGFPVFDVAVDPLEGTKLCAAGAGGAMATIALAEEGSLWSPGPAFYMLKLVVGPRAREAIDVARSPEENVLRVARALGKALVDLRVVVLDKPRHRDLIERLRMVGVRLELPTDGDVGGALQALLEDGGADLLIGIGGTPEGVMTACAARALGGGMQGRLAPQLDGERRALAVGGVDVARVLELEDLADGDSCFVATGVTDGDVLRGPWRTWDGTLWTESIVIASGSARRVVQALDLDLAP
jgi:fructose-1,6-bisphosphatase II